MTSAPEESQFVPVVDTAAGDAPAAAGTGAGAVRASDAERDEVAAMLSEALAQGRLTSAELAERIDAAYAAKTRAELVPLTADLPEDLHGNVHGNAHGATSGPIAAVERQELSATFSKVIRSGRWVAGRHTEAKARFGALIVNLADAVLPGREITLDVTAFCGKAIITIPENAQVVDEGGALFGKRSVTGAAPEGGQDGPIIRITGKSTFGKIVVHRRSSRDATNPALWWWEQRHQR